MFASGLLLIAFLTSSFTASADDNPPVAPSPTAVFLEPTVVFEVWPTVTGAANTATPAPPAIPTQEPATATALPPVADTATTEPAASPASEPVSQPAPPPNTAALPPVIFTPTPADTPTAIPTATQTGTPTPTASATPGWVPPGPACYVKPGKAVMKLKVPYLHQVNDVTGADGNWACGPASVLMVLAYYGKLEPWPDYVARQGGTPGPAPTPGAAGDKIKLDYAPYLTNVFTSNGHTYSATAPDPRGNKLAGLYGTISPGGLADWGKMKQVLEWYGLSTAYAAPTWNGVVAALKRGHPVLLGNDLTPAGHVMLAIGYTSNNQIIVNDPYGNRFAGGYGANDGEGVYYAWSCSRVRNALEVIGTYPPPTATPTVTATPTQTAAAIPQEVHADSLGPAVAAAVGTVPITGSATTVMRLGAPKVPPYSPDGAAQTSSAGQTAGREPPSVRVLAAQKSPPRPAYWLLAGPTLLVLAAFGLMYVDWRKKRR